MTEGSPRSRRATLHVGDRVLIDRARGAPRGPSLWSGQVGTIVEVNRERLPRPSRRTHVEYGVNFTVTRVTAKHRVDAYFRPDEVTRA